MSLAVVFGTNLRNFRKAKRLTQADLAEKVALSTEMISKMERGVAAPSFANIERLSHILNVSEAALFGGTLELATQDRRGCLLSKINSKLSRLNEEDLSRVDKIVATFLE